MATTVDHITVTEPEGMRSFQNLQATFSSVRRARPPPIDLSTKDDETRIPLKPGKLNRMDSKSGLRSMFTRHRADKLVVSPVEEEPLPTGISERTMIPEHEASLRRTSLTIKSTAPDSTPVTPSKPSSRTSRMNFKSRSVKQVKTNAVTPKSASKGSPKSTTSKAPARTSAAWDPPPLFQAYPQAIKHAQLSASTLSADSILRISNHKRSNSLRDDFAQTGSPGEGADQTAALKKAAKAKSRHRRQVSGSISKADWTQKIFVLVTSGYLLQYSGEGSFDRLPEKMMQLGKDSVAFASDAIPGKHWVLQVSQAMDSAGVPAADSRSLLSRLAFRNADYRRTATSLLLVLNSAEDLDSWIAIVRREIEALGGKKTVSETGKPKPDDKVMQLRAQPSHRYLVQRNPDQFSNPSSPMSPTFGPPSWNSNNELQTKLEDAASYINSNRPLTGHQSVTNSFVSHDDRQPDNLKENPNRLSYMSSGQRTLFTSQGSSATSSPTRESTSTLEDFPAKLSSEDVKPRPNAYAINERRRSMQTLKTTVTEPQPKQFRPHSTFGMPAPRPSRTYSPPPTTPNFSVPTSSNKRFSTSRNPAFVAPPIPTIITTTPSKTMMKGNRKTPPTALKVKSLSPVTDSPSPSKTSPQIYTPTESSFRKVEQLKASVVDIPARSPTSPTQPDLVLPRRLSSLMPLTCEETAHIDFRFPRRHSSMLALREAVEGRLEAPSKPAPLPPAALTIPLPPSPLILDSDEAAADFEIEAVKEETLQVPILASAKPSLRRPTSLQMQPVSNSPIMLSPSPSANSAKSPRLSPSHTTPSAASSETLKSLASPAIQSLKSPLTQRSKGHSSPQNLTIKKSMPMLASGPPPLPPPDCALPPLPPPNRSPASVRNSVQV